MLILIVQNILHSHHFQEFQVILQSQVYLHLRRVPNKSYRYSVKKTQLKQLHKSLTICNTYRRTVLAIVSPLSLKQKRFNIFRGPNTELFLKCLTDYTDNGEKL